MNVEATVKVLLATQLGLTEAEIKPEQKLGEDLGVDSLDCVEILMAAEDEFNVLITDEESEKITTVAGLIDCVRSKVPA